MKIISIYFDYGGVDKYEKLARVFEHSIKKNSSDVDYEIIKIQAPEVKSNNKSFESNTVKLELWMDKLKETEDDIVFMDVDMMIVRDISDAFDDHDFDIGITMRNGPHAKRLPMNGGVVFVRNNEAAKEFIKLWTKANRFLYDDILRTHGTKHHRFWRSRYGGMNQAAYGYMIHNYDYDARIKEFQCSEWNACVEHWRNPVLNPRIIHVKSQLRTTVLSNKPTKLVDISYRRQVEAWRALASEIGYDMKSIDDVIIGLQPVRKLVRDTDKRRSRYLRRYG
jgi:hypothetical protein